MEGGLLIVLTGNADPVDDQANDEAHVGVEREPHNSLLLHRNVLLKTRDQGTFKEHSRNI
jgi:hypothetical protein